MKTHLLDITGDHCPMTFVRTKLELEKLAPGERLEVTLREGEPLNNVPKTAEEQGYKVLETTQLEGSIYRVLIEK